MDNPWKSIRLSDYENHMKLNTVMQLQALNSMMKKQLNTYPVHNVMILGVAGGNGLEYIDTGKYSSVYGVDINSEYLYEVQKRYENLDNILKCICIDLTAEIYKLPFAELIIANLLIEYIGYECFQKIITYVKPKYVSCGIQINADDEFVSDSPYTHAFDELSNVHQQIEADKLIKAMSNIGYKQISQNEYLLPNQKKLTQVDFEWSKPDKDIGY